MSMKTETIEITGLPSGTINALQKKAGEIGQTTANYLRNLIEAELLAPQSFDEILAPMRQGFTESGMSDAELDSLFEEAREEVWRTQQARRR